MVLDVPNVESDDDEDASAFAALEPGASEERPGEGARVAFFAA